MTITQTTSCAGAVGNAKVREMEDVCARVRAHTTPAAQELEGEGKGEEDQMRRQTDRLRSVQGDMKQERVKPQEGSVCVCKGVCVCLCVFACGCVFACDGVYF